MSTNFITVQDQHFATRYYAGKEKGMVLLLNYTENEMKNLSGFEVSPEDQLLYLPFDEWIEKEVKSGCVVEYQTTESLKFQADEFENHRFNSILQSAIQSLRLRAQVDLQHQLGLV